MKYFYALFLLSITVIGCTNDKNKNEGILDLHQIAKDTSYNFKHVSPDSVFKVTRKIGNWIVLDVRTPQEVALGYIPIASVVNVRDSNFINQVDLLDKKKEIYVYCNTGVGRSDSAAAILKANGFPNVSIIKGGFLGWEDANLPVKESKGFKDKNLKTFSLDSFNKLLKSNNLVFVDFHTLWCRTCIEMAPIVDSISEVFKGKTLIKRINIVTSKEIRKAYNISGVPVFMIFKDGNPKPVWIYKGFIKGQVLANKLTSYIH